MAQIPSSQGAPQASNIAVQDALPLIGSLSRENGQTVLNSIDAELAKLFEDRNVLLAEGGTLAWSTTTNNLTLSAALKLHINSQVAGGSPTIVDLANTTRAFSADGRMLYAVVNRSAGTAVVTADATTLPSVVAANVEVFLLAKRIGTDIYFRNGFRLTHGQTANLGRTGSVLDSEFLINDASDPTKQIAFDAAGTTGTKTTIASSQTTNKTLTLPDATDTLVGKATTDVLSNKTLDFLRESSANDNTSGSAVTLASVTTGVVRLTNSSLVSVAGIPAGVSGQSLRLENATGTAITLLEDNTGATAANRLYLGLNGAITVLAQQAVLFTYDSTSQRWYVTGGSGSGSGTGFKNIISDLNSKFPGGVGDWVTYDDGAVAAPVDGTGGSPAAITISSTSTVGEVLEGLQSLKIAKSAADGQGEGTSVLSKTIDRADMGKPFFVYFDYDATHANYVYGDLRVFAYDVTNSQLLTVYNDSNNGQLLQQKGLFSGVIYPQDTCAQIRLILHCTSTNALAYNVFLDEVVITPQANIVGPVITPWTDFTPTGSWVTNTTYTGKYRRIGDSMEVAVKISTSGAPTATALTVNLPSGYAIDTTKLVSTAAFNTFAGSISFNDSLASFYGPGAILYNSSTSVSMKVANVAGTYSQPAQVTATVPFTFGAGDDITAIFTVPISGWSAGATLSANDAGLQTVIAKATATTSAAVSAGNPTPFATEVYDNYQAYNPATGQLTAPRSGYYRVYGAISTGTGARQIFAYVGGVQQSIVGTADSNGECAFAGLVRANIGETIDIRPVGGSYTINNDSSINFESVPDFNVFGVQGPIVVAPMEDWTTFTPTLSGFGTVTASGGAWRRVGDSMEVVAYWTNGTVAASLGSITIPNGYAIDANKIARGNTTAASGQIVGEWAQDANANSGWLITATATNTSLVYFGDNFNGTNSTIPTNVSAFSVNSDKATVRFTVPIYGWSSETRLYPTQRVIGTTYLKDVKSSGTAGGTATSGSYQTRTLNTQEGDSGFCSLSSNQFTLQPGTYEIFASAPGAAVSQHKAKIRNITDSTDAIIGQSSNDAAGSQASSVMEGRIVIATAKTFEVQHRVTSTSATTGFGFASSFGENEVYTIVKIDKIY